MLAKHQLSSWCRELGAGRGFPGGSPFLAAATVANTVTVTALDNDDVTTGIND